MFEVIKNTYPIHKNVPSASIGDLCEWELIRGGYSLVRISDSKTIFRSADVNRDGLLISTKQSPILVGVIAYVKSKGWILEINEYSI